jgi:hypothetical protein
MIKINRKIKHFTITIYTILLSKMAPVTRSQTNAIQGQFFKDVLEHPPVLKCVISHLLNEQPDNKSKFDELFSLRLVFKLESTVDVIQYNISKVKKYEKQKKHFDIFIKEMKNLIKINNKKKSYNVDAAFNNMINIYELIIKNKQIFSENYCVSSINNLKKTSIDRLYVINKDNFNFRLQHGDRLLEQMLKI